MLKLAIMAGVTLSALLCGMMTLGSNGLFQSNNNNFGLINDIKEIFGFNPRSNQLSSNSQYTSNTGESSSFSFGGGGYLPPKSVSEDDYNSTDLTTPLFRIFILSTSTSAPTDKANAPSPKTTVPSPTSTEATIQPASIITVPSTTSTEAANSPSSTTTTPPSTTTSSNTPLTTKIMSTTNTTFKQEALAEGTTLSSVSVSPSPTPYAFQGNPSPQFKIDLIWSTLVPPSLASNSENEVVLNENTKSASAGTGGSGAVPLPNNGLYLPPTKEYLPPTQ